MPILISFRFGNLRSAQQPLFKQFSDNIPKAQNQRFTHWCIREFLNHICDIIMGSNFFVNGR